VDYFKISTAFEYAPVYVDQTQVEITPPDVVEQTPTEPDIAP
jgi:hypothetical protein